MTGEALLARRDPAVLLAATLVVPLVLLRVREPGPVVLLWVAAMVAARALARVPWRRLALGQLPFVAFGTSLVAVNAVTRGSDPLAQVVAVLGPLEITDVGLRTGVALAARTLVVGVCALAFLQVVDPGRLLGSLHQVARVPIRFTVALTAAHRVLEDLPAEWATVRRAHALRAPVADPGRVVEAPVPAQAPRLPASPTALRRAAFALLATGIRRSERMAVALETRALGALGRDERTVWRPARADGRDAVVVVVVVAVCAAVAHAAR
ncbi:energy-coupling factor transporter transmembrane component T family protein [Actinotalea ferrariae]|nr:energy-coupling factor transporter transmembrane component T [Actinotalea ferrariae]